MKVKLCNSLFEVANIREQTDTTGQAKLSERPKRRISVKLTIWLAHLCQFVPGTKSHNWVASRVKNRTVLFRWELRREYQIQNKNIWKMVENYYRSIINFERTFWYPRILPKNKRTSSFIVLLGKKHKYIRSFFGRIVGFKKHFDSFWRLKSFNIFAQVNSSF